MAVVRKPVSGLFRHPIDGAHAAHILREKGFSKIDIRTIPEAGHSRSSSKKRPLAAVAGAVAAIGAAIICGLLLGQFVSKVAGVFAALGLAFFGLLSVMLYVLWPSSRVERYPRRDGVLLTVLCQGEEQPEVAETLRHAGAVKIMPQT